MQKVVLGVWIVPVALIVLCLGALVGRIYQPNAAPCDQFNPSALADCADDLRRLRSAFRDDPLGVLQNRVSEVVSTCGPEIEALDRASRGVP